MLDLTPRPFAPVEIEGLFHVRILALRAGVAQAEAAPASVSDEARPCVERLVRKRLDVVRGGLREACRQVCTGRTAEAVDLVERLEEDLAMLQRRLGRAAGPPRLPR
jgi:hypothetical protein